MENKDIIDPAGEQYKIAQDEKNRTFNKSEDQLLTELYLLSGHNPYRPVAVTEMLTFSTLLLKLSQRAEKQTNTIVDLTKNLVWFTRVVVFLTCVLILQGFFNKPIVKFDKTDQKINLINQKTDKSNLNNINIDTITKSNNVHVPSLKK